MNAIRQNLKELKPVFEELPLLKKLLEYAKNILVVGCILWVLGGLIPDTAHFAVTFFSSIGRVLLFTGLFFALVRGDEDRFIMGASIFISIFSFIIIIIELASVSYLASFESYLFLALSCALAVNIYKQTENNLWNAAPDKQESDDGFFDFADTEYEEEPVIKVETIVHAAPEIQTETFIQEDPPASDSLSDTQATPSAQPDVTSQLTPQPHIAAQIAEPIEQLETPPQQTPPNKTKAPVPSENNPEQTEAAAPPVKTADSNPFEIKRAPSIGSAPSVGPAPRVSIKPKNEG